jgi:hypothetical protein
LGWLDKGRPKLGSRKVSSMSAIFTIVVAVLAFQSGEESPSLDRGGTRTKTLTLKQMSDCENILINGGYRRFILEDEQLLEISCKLKQE